MKAVTKKICKLHKIKAVPKNLVKFIRKQLRYSPFLSNHVLFVRNLLKRNQVPNPGIFNKLFDILVEFHQILLNFIGN